MENFFVRISSGKYQFIEDVTEMYKELAEDWNEKEDFENKKGSFRELEIKDVTSDKLEEYNKKNENQHVVYGYLECLSQSEYCPQWIRKADNIDIEFYWK